jgi:hypothetical protein
MKQYDPATIVAILECRTYRHEKRKPRPRLQMHINHFRFNRNPIMLHEQYDDILCTTGFLSIGQ